MFENILKAQLKIWEYSRNNQLSLINSNSQGTRIKISILLVELSKLLVYFISAV